MPDVQQPAGWTLVIPIKHASHGKTRLDAPASFARAIALDTLDAACAATRVTRIIVVTADPVLVMPGSLPSGVEVISEPASEGISAAILRALTGLGGARAVLLGDVPTLDPVELDLALAWAADVDRGFVPDAEGTGTVLVTAREGVSLLEAFGVNSAGKHRELGLCEIPVGVSSSLRRDVDTWSQLARIPYRKLRAHTRAIIDAELGG